MSDNANFYSLIQAAFPADPGKPFLSGPDYDGLRYADIEPLTRQLLNLFAEYSISPGARVVAQVPKSPMAVILYLACLRAGVIYVPLNTAYTHDELDYFLEDTAPTLFVCDPEHEEALSDLFFKHNIPYVLLLDQHGRGSLVERMAGLDREQGVTRVGPDDTAVIIYTSGTTGKPKGAMLSHRNLASNALSLYKLWDWQQDDVLIHALPIYHIHGLFVALHLPLLGGSSIHFLERYDADAILDLMPVSSVLMGVPTFYTRLLQNKRLEPGLCAAMRLFISGSAPLLEDTFRQFEQASGHKILERYGMSETGMLASNPLHGERIPGTVGFPLPEVTTRIRDEQGRDPGPGGIGVLQVKGENVFAGYWRKPEITRQEFSEGYFITGDLASMDAGGRLRIVGRNKDLIISGGFNVYPKEIEDVLDNKPAVIESAVIGVAHPDLGEAVVAVLVCAEGEEPDPEALIAELKEQLAGYKVPKKMFTLDQLPRNSMGKVQKKALRERFGDTFNDTA